MLVRLRLEGELAPHAGGAFGNVENLRHSSSVCVAVVVYRELTEKPERDLKLISRAIVTSLVSLCVTKGKVLLLK